MDYIYLKAGTPEWEYFVEAARTAGDFDKDLRISTGSFQDERNIKVKVGQGMWSHPLWETKTDTYRDNS